MSDEQNSTRANLEASVLGGIILRNDTLALLPRLDPTDFATARYRHVFSAMRRLEAAGRPIDVVTLEAELGLMGVLESVGGVATMGELAGFVPTPDNTVEYARRVRDAAMADRVTASLSSLLARHKQHGGTGEELLSAALEALSVLDVDQPDDAKPIGHLVRDRFKEFEAIIAAREAGDSKLTGIPTGVSRLDERMGGYQPGIVTILAGRPQHGKSTVALAGADAATAAGFGAHLFTLEDSWRSYADRSLARVSSVPAETMRSCDLNRGQMSNLQQAASKLWHRKRWLVDDRSGIEATEIVRSVRRHRKKNETRVVFVDYLQLVRRPRGASEYEALGEIMLTFATAAKQDGIAYVVLSQLNRELEKRPDKRPQLSDLRGSGSIEEYCKAAIGVYRGSVYGGEPKPDIDYRELKPGEDMKNVNQLSLKPDSDEEWERRVQLLILKNSNGATGRVFASWDGPTFRVE